MPSHWSVVLRPRGRDVPKPSPRACHAMARTWLDDPPSAGAGLQPETFYSVGRPLWSDDAVVVPLGLVDDARAELLVERAQPGPLRFRQKDGSTAVDPGWEIEALELDVSIPWDALVTMPVVHHWEITHLTAATRQLDRGQYDCDISTRELLRRPFAALQQVYGGDDEVEDLLPHILVSDVELSSRVFHPVIGAGASRLTVSGLEGRRRWRIKDADAAQVVGAALRVAEFTGVGALVTYGFGQVQVKPVNPRSKGRPERRSR